MQNHALTPPERNGGPSLSGMSPLRGETIPVSYYGEPHLDDDEPRGDSDALARYVRALSGRKSWLLLAGTLGAVVALVPLLDKVPLYRARTLIEIQPVNNNFMNMRDLDPTVAGHPGSDLPTDIAILQSRATLEKVARKLSAQKRPAITTEPNTVWRTLERFGLGARRSTWSWDESVRVAAETAGAAAMGPTRVVEIWSESPHPEAAAEFANALANAFIDQNMESRWQATQRTGEWLSRQLDDLRAKLQKSEFELQAYGRATGLIFSPNNNTAAADKLRQVREDLFKAQSARMAQQSRYEMVTSAKPEALLEIVDDSALRGYQAKLADLRQQMADLTTSLTPEHYRVQRLKAQIVNVEAAFNEERSRLARRIQNEYETASRQEALLTDAHKQQSRIVADQEEKAIKYNLLKREVDTTRQLYDALLQKMKEASVASTLLASNIRVVDPAQTPTELESPSMAKYASAGFLTGLSLCAVALLGLAMIDRSLKTPGELASYLNVPELGVIPAAKADPGAGRRVAATERGSGLRASFGTLLREASPAPPEIDRVEDRIELITWHRKSSMMAESFRATLASILFSKTNGEGPRVIAVTSTSALAGKSTVTSNLALALAEISKRVLVIDADWRKPRMHDIFGVPNTWGLSDILKERTPLDNCPLEALARNTKVPGLWVLPSGPEPVNASSLLCSERMVELLERLRRDFDRVLIDTRPMLQFVDARLVGRLSDGLVLVFRAGQTTRQTALLARKRLQDDGATVLGAILNDWTPTDRDSGGYYGYELPIDNGRSRT